MQYSQHKPRSSQGGIGALVLAAGFSNRFGSLKLCASLPDGQTVFSRTLANLTAAIPDVLVITRPEVACQLDIHDAELLVFEDAEQGMGATLAFGIRHILRSRSWDGCLVCLADMPYIRPGTYGQIAKRLTSHTIVMPRFRGRSGNPAGFGKAFFPELSGLTGDHGGRQVLSAHADAVIQQDLDDAAILYDIDTPEDLALAASQAV